MQLAAKQLTVSVHESRELKMKKNNNTQTIAKIGII